MTISIIWIPKFELDTQMILKIGNQWCVAFLAFYASSFVPWKMAQELNAVRDWKAHSAGNKSNFSRCLESSIVKILREGKEIKITIRLILCFVNLLHVLPIKI